MPSIPKASRGYVDHRLPEIRHYNRPPLWHKLSSISRRCKTRSIYRKDQDRRVFVCPVCINDWTSRIARSYARKQEIIVHHGRIRETTRSYNDHGSRPKEMLLHRMTTKD